MKASGVGTVPKLDARTVLEELRSMADPKAAAGMKRFGISSGEIFGVSILSSALLQKR